MSAPAALDGARVDRLNDWLHASVEGFSGPLSITRLPGGQSNPTYLLGTPARSYVLRAKPPGVAHKGAHAVDREARIMTALRGTPVPVPFVHALCTDDSVLGSWFYVMDFVEGRALRDARFPEVAPGSRAAHQLALVDTLAALHRIRPAAVGLDDFGPPAGYVRRQIDRWSRQYRADGEAGRHPLMDRLVEWLSANVPAADETTLVHGDYRVDNTIFHPCEPRLAAVIDWELSTLGHPLADFAYHAMMFRLPPDILGGIGSPGLRDAGLLGESDYVSRYCEMTGRKSIDGLEFYLALNMFRFAAILHGIRARLRKGTAVASNAAEAASRFERVAELAWEQVRKAG